MTEKKHDFKNLITSAGLTDDQALLYELLLRNGPRAASWLSKTSGLSRPQAYKVLDQLLEMNFVLKDKTVGSTAKFSSAHPFALQEFIRRKQEDLRITEEAMQGMMGSLISIYSHTSQTPGLQVNSGTPGIEALYKDILRTRTDIKILRAGKDRFALGLSELVTENIKKQHAAGIRAQALCPSHDSDDLDALKAHDSMYGIERRTYPNERFSLPAQIMLYGNKVGIIAYETPPLTTIIENEAISMSFKVLFDLLWSQADI